MRPPLCVSAAGRHGPATIPSCILLHRYCNRSMLSARRSWQDTTYRHVYPNPSFSDRCRPPQWRSSEQPAPSHAHAGIGVQQLKPTDFFATSPILYHLACFLSNCCYPDHANAGVGVQQLKPTDSFATPPILYHLACFPSNCCYPEVVLKGNLACSHPPQVAEIQDRLKGVTARIRHLQNLYFAEERATGRVRATRRISTYQEERYCSNPPRCAVRTPRSSLPS